MKVLLLENVQGLGKKGDIVEVKDGYGKNFLIAKGKANHATNEVINKYKAQLKRQAEQEALDIAEINGLKSRIESLNLVLHRKVGANNTLFGSITKEDIAIALATHRVNVDKKSIEIKENMKRLGYFEVQIKLGYSINALLKCEVKAQKEEK